jgi:hypothetical protein
MREMLRRSKLKFNNSQTKEKLSWIEKLPIQPELSSRKPKTEKLMLERRFLSSKLSKQLQWTITKPPLTLLSKTLWMLKSLIMIDKSRNKKLLKPMPISK